MSSKSLPSSLNQNQRASFHNNSTLSQIQTVKDSEDQIQSICSLYFSSSNVNISSPLTKPAWLNEANSVNTSSSGATSNKSWIPHRWSTVSGSLIARRKHKKSTASRLWTNRQKRRTFPPASNILKRERDKFALPTPINKNQHQRQSLQDILSTFYKYNNTSCSRGSNIDFDSTSPTSSSSSMSKKFARIWKKREKQPLKRPLLTNTEHTKQEELDIATMTMPIFHPSATISCISSTPSSPLLHFPTPPERFSAFYYMHRQQGDVKMDNKSKMEASHDMSNLMQHGASSVHHVSPKERTNISSEGQHREYNKQLLLGASLFLFGFIFFPFWWIGTWVCFKKRKQSNAHQVPLNDVYCENDLISIRTLAYLNCIFSCFSLLLVSVILSLVILTANS